jgi:hypothetical protein
VPIVPRADSVWWLVVPLMIAGSGLVLLVSARHRSLQVALLIPILAGMLGLVNSFRMLRLPDPKPSGTAEGMVLG